MPDLPPVFADLQKRVSDLVGGAAQTGDFQAHLRQALDAALQRMDLVTREEFEQQQRLLLLATEKLAALEALVASRAGQAESPTPGSSGSGDH